MTTDNYPPLPYIDPYFPAPVTADLLQGYAALAVKQALAQQATRHAEELLAAEITIGKLREQNDTAISVVSRLLQVHEDRSIEDATNLAYAMLSAAPAPEPERKPMTEEQLELLYRENSGYGGDDFNSFARAIEAFHGIKE